jgi:hypothetical protein
LQKLSLGGGGKIEKLFFVFLHRKRKFAKVLKNKNKFGIRLLGSGLLFRGKKNLELKQLYLKA